MNAPRNPHAKDAEAAGRYALSYLRPKHKRDANVSPDVIYLLARWAFHWAAMV